MTDKQVKVKTMFPVTSFFKIDHLVTNDLRFGASYKIISISKDLIFLKILGNLIVNKRDFETSTEFYNVSLLPFVGEYT